MAHQQSDPQVIELKDEFQWSEGVSFDPEHITLEGAYTDQLSAYRARKVWLETFETNFLLEPEHDFSLKVCSSFEDNKFALKCQFLTACARYAFWRLTNNQAPEAQYIIETAHIPNAELRHDDFLQAPDLKSVHEAAIIAGVERATREVEENTRGLAQMLKKLVSTLVTR
ncbi:MAG: hypothetical protein J0M12_08285 [Deltaproteobacteria bacterium]|nr:hypothetical protein [Deltaproteobacteria bacterium]